MPHFGLMDAAALGPERAALQRARLHLRGGRRRLRQGRISSGIAALADGLTYALEWFCASPERRALIPAAFTELQSDRALFAALVGAGILDGAFAFERFERLVDLALESELKPEDATGIAEGLEAVFTQLGVLPFDESELPPEDPATP